MKKKRVPGQSLNDLCRHPVAWQERLPDVVAAAADRYGLRDLVPVSHVSIHYVLEGFQSERPIILKLCPDRDALRREVAAMKLCAGYGSVEILADDDLIGHTSQTSGGVVLMERAMPGTPLRSYFPEQDEAAVHIAAAVMNRLHQAPGAGDHPFPHVKAWCAALDDGGSLGISKKYLHAARTIRDELMASAGPDHLLHGDLHHDNILKHHDGWCVIDPHGVIGERAYEIGAFMRNPKPELLEKNNLEGVFERRIQIFSSCTDIPADRIAAWSFVQAVLAWVWAAQDRCDTAYWEAVAQRFHAFICMMIFAIQPVSLVFW